MALIAPGWKKGREEVENSPGTCCGNERPHIIMVSLGAWGGQTTTAELVCMFMKESPQYSTEFPIVNDPFFWFLIYWKQILWIGCANYCASSLQSSLPLIQEHLAVIVGDRLVLRISEMFGNAFVLTDCTKHLFDFINITIEKQSVSDYI